MLKITQLRNWMCSAAGLLACVALLPSQQCWAEATQILPADTMGNPGPTFTKGSITLAPFAAGGDPGSFNVGPYIGVNGGQNNNAVGDADGILGGTDQERMDMTFAAGFGLSEMRFGFTRARPIILSGFTGNPLVSVIQDTGPANTTTASWNAALMQLEITQTVFVATETIFSFGDTSVSAGQTISLVVADAAQAGPQAAIARINSDVAIAAVPGDVDGDGEVTPADFTFIRDNFFKTGQTRRQGDLVPNGNLSVVDFADYQQWADNFDGNASLYLAQLTGTAVPEPSGLVLAAVAIGLVATAGRRRIL